MVRDMVSTILLQFILIFWRGVVLDIGWLKRVKSIGAMQMEGGSLDVIAFRISILII
jgi:hypothetical protein